MARHERSRYCKVCEKQTLHVKQQVISDGVGCLLTIITIGTFLVAWIPLILIDAAFQPWRCQTCGSKN